MKSVVESSNFECLPMKIEDTLHKVLALFNIIRSLSSVPDNANVMVKDMSLMHIYSCLFKISRKFKSKKVQNLRNKNIKLKTELPDIDRLMLENKNEAAEKNKENDDKDKMNDSEENVEENSNDSGLDDFNERLETALENVYKHGDMEFSKYNESPTLIAVLNEIEVDAMVTLCNLAFEIDLISWPEKTAYEVINLVVDSIINIDDCEVRDGIDSITPGKHSMAMEMLVKLSTRVGNLDMIWMTPSLVKMERAISILIEGIPNRDNQIQRELCLSALSCILPSHNSIAQDIETFSFDNQDEVSTNTFMKIMKSHPSKPVEILLNFLEDSIGISATTEVVHRRIPSQDPTTRKPSFESQPILRYKY